MGYIKQNNELKNMKEKENFQTFCDKFPFLYFRHDRVRKKHRKEWKLILKLAVEIGNLGTRFAVSQ